MAKKLLLAFAAITTLSILVLAATRPNFSGTWNMDRGRSFGMPGDMTQVLTITQKDDQMEVETKIIQPNNERTVKDTYYLDGKEHEFTPVVPPGQPPAKGKRTASWMPGEVGLLVTDITTAQTPKGEVTTQNQRKWTINSQGELVIDSYVDNPQMSYEAKRIFKKQP
ncbi:MAG TPA: hypothetical protein VJ749_09820 [Pyrinomonadaceae bacterium]|nr:hypothetical protein [Pyrinomonadaceae bacterium]